ncbi:ubiquitin [Theileria orientalis strain Shintoku]|uniref:Ubiquitin n=1 Tax=Theileria orientalis strain Shintoku TaxID=869250 RepID=J4DP03_THEOR|nr:ubiquitin [Theileria orientalis strain Shintoku]BAM39859.1 ubiquitin [Theileria orientalis strain Shintoku]|eukprot:XP_009690160.1 ubiquitin [Theileria orientalis strain Shintoku]
MFKFIIFYLFCIYGTLVLSLRRDKSHKNLIINTLNKKLNVHGDINTFEDIKKRLAEQHGITDYELISNNKILKGDEIYSRDKHNDLNLVSNVRGGLNLTVETMQGKSIQVQVSQNETVLDVKKKLEEEQTIPVDQQRLIYKGKLLENEKTIADYGIKDNEVLQLVLRLRGG